jgi:hypothetical protein
MERGCLDSAVRGSVTEDLEEELGLLGRDPAQVVVRMADALFQERKKYQGAVSERDAARDEAGWLAPIADALNSWIREHRCGEGWQTEGWDGGDIIDKLRRWHGELNGIHRQALANVERERDAALARAEKAEDKVSASERALRTRPDYDLRCDRCGAPHNLDTSVPSDKWNKVMRTADGDRYSVLCTLCIDELFVEAGVECDVVEFYFVGSAISSRLYAESTGDVEYQTRRAEAAEAERDKLRMAGRTLLGGWDARRAIDRGERGMGSNIATERAGAYTSTFYWEQLRKALDNRAQEEE